MISKKALTKSLINEYSILNGITYFVGARYQSYLVFQPIFTYF